jgi:putative PIN family toxin of toxin-antitoxin system
LARRKFGLTEEILSEWQRTFQVFTTTIETEIRLDFTRDQKDAKFLECTYACGAKYLVTGDTDFEASRAITDTEIISVTQFKQLFLDQ